MFAVFFCVWKIGEGSLASWDEAMYAQVAREMVQSGDWVNLRFLESDWYVKPPFAIWGTALFFKLWGVSEFTARFFSALGGIGAVLACYFLGLAISTRRAAFLGAGALLGTTEFLHFARWGMMDVPNLFFFTAAIACFVRGSSHGGWFLGFWVFAAAAFMTKGPVIALAGAVILVRAVWRRDFSFLKSPHFWAGLPVAVVLVLPWHVAAWRHNPGAFLRDFIGIHWFARAAGAIDGHARGVTFYVRAIINKYHPWAVLLPFALPATLWAAFWRKEAGPRLLAAWVAVVFSFFTFLVGTKLNWYILPVYPALCLSVGTFLDGRMKRLPEIWPRALVASVVVFHVYFSSVIVQDYSGGIKSAAGIARKAGLETPVIHLYRYHEAPAAVFYFGGEARYLDTDTEVDEVLRRPEVFHLVVPAGVFDTEGQKFLARGLKPVIRTALPKDNIVLLSNRPLAVRPGMQ